MIAWSGLAAPASSGCSSVEGWLERALIDERGRGADTTGGNDGAGTLAALLARAGTSLARGGAADDSLAGDGRLTGKTLAVEARLAGDTLAGPEGRNVTGVGRELAEAGRSGTLVDSGASSQPASRSSSAAAGVPCVYNESLFATEAMPFTSSCYWRQLSCRMSVSGSAPRFF
jgi:hypothetical protein